MEWLIGIDEESPLGSTCLVVCAIVICFLAVLKKTVKESREIGMTSDFVTTGVCFCFQDVFQSEINSGPRAH